MMSCRTLLLDILLLNRAYNQQGADLYIRFYYTFCKLCLQQTALHLASFRLRQLSYIWFEYSSDLDMKGIISETHDWLQAILFLLALFMVTLLIVSKQAKKPITAVARDVGNQMSEKVLLKTTDSEEFIISQHGY